MNKPIKEPPKQHKKSKKMLSIAAITTILIIGPTFSLVPYKTPQVTKDLTLRILKGRIVKGTKQIAIISHKAVGGRRINMFDPLLDDFSTVSYHDTLGPSVPLDSSIIDFLFHPEDPNLVFIQK